MRLSLLLCICLVLARVAHTTLALPFKATIKTTTKNFSFPFFYNFGSEKNNILIKLLKSQNGNIFSK